MFNIYKIKYLYDEIGAILGLDKQYKIVIVGYGRLGQAMANYIKKNEGNFHISGIFDVKQIIRDVEFENAQVLTCANLSTFIRDENIDIAVITVPAEKAQLVAETAVDAGVKAIWNFTTVDLELPEDVVVENVHLSDSLHALAYYMQDM